MNEHIKLICKLQLNKKLRDRLNNETKRAEYEFVLLTEQLKLCL